MTDKVFLFIKWKNVFLNIMFVLFTPGLLNLIRIVCLTNLVSISRTILTNFCFKKQDRLTCFFMHFKKLAFWNICIELPLLKLSPGLHWRGFRREDNLRHTHLRHDRLRRHYLRSSSWLRGRLDRDRLQLCQQEKCSRRFSTLPLFSLLVFL